MSYYCHLSEEVYPDTPKSKCEICPWWKGEGDIEVRALMVCLPVDEFRQRLAELPDDDTA